jgi:hypothetical protein
MLPLLLLGHGDVLGVISSHYCTRVCSTATTTAAAAITVAAAAVAAGAAGKAAADAWAAVSQGLARGIHDGGLEVAAGTLCTVPRQLSSALCSGAGPAAFVTQQGKQQP